MNLKVFIVGSKFAVGPKFGGGLKLDVAIWIRMSIYKLKLFFVF